MDTGGGFSSTKLENIRQAQHLRTFRTFGARYGNFSPDLYNEIFHILSTLGSLRVLSLSYCAGAAKMLCSTSKLKHLRYLDLSWSDLVTLPEEVRALLNLQTLILEYCRQLASLPDLGNLKYLRHLNLQATIIERLPESLERLINLRYLNISRTSLKEMPPNIGQLTKLRTLTDFLVGRQSETSIKELGKLHLRGALHIGNLQNVVDARDAGEANLKGKKHLDRLRFTWDGDTHDPQHVRSTLEKLEPNRNVKHLQIEGYGGVRFPEWVGESSFSNIVSLKLIRCTNCTSLPPLGQLASLEYLSIKNSLSISDCPDLESLCAHERPLNDLTSLHVLYIHGCPKLVSFPKGGLPAPVLTRLALVKCSNLKQLPESMHSRLPSLKDLSIRDCLEVELCQEGGFPSTLQSLDIFNCNKLFAGRMQWGLQTLPSLSYFTIGGHENCESFPEEMLLPSSLTSLHIDSLQHLKSLDCKGLQHLTSLRELTISNCPLIESMPEEGLPSSLSTLAIYYCPMLGESCEREKGKD